MDFFEYRDGSLFAEGVNVEEIAREFGTPTYVYSASTLRLHYQRLTEAFSALKPLVCFSIKCNSNLSVLRLLAGMGCGMDAVSGGELHRARLAGVPASKMVYAGVGKSDHEILMALGHDPQSLCAASERSPREPIFAFNIESEEEFINIAELAARVRALGSGSGSGVVVVGSDRGQHAAPICRAALRINPDVDAHTHKYTTTGTRATKFGVDLTQARAFFARHGRNPHLQLSGLHLHLGSPIYTTQPYVDALVKTLDLIDTLKRDGFEIDTLDLGGGFGADYRTGQTIAASEYAKAIVPLLEPRVREGLRVILEPGRFIAASAGVLLTRVEYVKRAAGAGSSGDDRESSGDDCKSFVICDAGMHTLIRPALYEAFHFVWPTRCAPEHVPSVRAEQIDAPGLIHCDVVGPICETADFLALDRRLPPVKRGDLLCVFTAGAYGMTMASRYNSHTLPAEVLVDGTSVTLARQRETYDDLVALERM